MNDSDSGEDDTVRYFVNESPLHSDGPHISSHKSPVLFWVWRVERAGRGGAGGGEGATAAPMGTSSPPQSPFPSEPEPDFGFNSGRQKINK